MNKSANVGIALAAGLLVVGVLSRARRERLGSTVGQRMLRRMERMMEKLPAGSPPKLVMSVLPQLRAQNEQIIEMLREQNDLLRGHQQRPGEPSVQQK